MALVFGASGFGFGGFGFGASGSGLKIYGHPSVDKCGVYGDLSILYPKPNSIYLRGSKP